jgi:hypothetical protein
MDHEIEEGAGEGRSLQDERLDDGAEEGGERGAEAGAVAGAALAVVAAAIVLLFAGHVEFVAT